MPTNLDNITYIEDQLSLGHNLISTKRHWYVYILDGYRIYHHVNNDNTDNRLLVPINFKFNFLRNLALLDSNERLVLHASDGHIFTSV